MLVDMESGEDASWRKAHALRGVLDEGDAMAGYEEETVSPVTVLGVEASYTTLMSTSGFVATGGGPWLSRSALPGLPHSGAVTGERNLVSKPPPKH